MEKPDSFLDNEASPAVNLSVSEGENGEKILGNKKWKCQILVPRSQQEKKKKKSQVFVIF